MTSELKQEVIELRNGSHRDEMVKKYKELKKF